MWATLKTTIYSLDLEGLVIRCGYHCLKGVPRLGTLIPCISTLLIDIYGNNPSPQHIIKVISQQFIKSPCYRTKYSPSFTCKEKTGKVIRPTAKNLNSPTPSQVTWLNPRAVSTQPAGSDVQQNLIPIHECWEYTVTIHEASKTWFIWDFMELFLTKNSINRCKNILFLACARSLNSDIPGFRLLSLSSCQFLVYTCKNMKIVER